MSSAPSAALVPTAAATAAAARTSSSDTTISLSSSSHDQKKKREKPSSKHRHHHHHIRRQKKHQLSSINKKDNKKLLPSMESNESAAPSEKDVETWRQAMLDAIRKIQQQREGSSGLVDPGSGGFDSQQFSALLEVLEKAPRVFREETDPASYYEHCLNRQLERMRKKKTKKSLLLQKNSGSIVVVVVVDEAVRKLAAYWQRRKSYYGDRFCLPLLNLDGVNGALQREDLDALFSGFHLPLPDDKHGRQVVYFNNSLSHPSIDGHDGRIRRLRANYFIWTVVSQRKFRNNKAVSCCASARRMLVRWRSR